jgi:hypothetical protein
MTSVYIYSQPAHRGLRESAVRTEIGVTIFVCTVPPPRTSPILARAILIPVVEQVYVCTRFEGIDALCAQVKYETKRAIASQYEFRFNYTGYEAGASKASTHDVIEKVPVVGKVSFCLRFEPMSVACTRGQSRRSTGRNIVKLAAQCGV